MLAELEIIPLGTKTASLSALLAEVAKLIDSSGLDYRVGPMGTVVEGDWDQIMRLARQCHIAVLQSSHRVMTTGDALSLNATFVHLRMPWLLAAVCGLALISVGTLGVKRLHRS